MIYSGGVVSVVCIVSLVCPFPSPPPCSPKTYTDLLSSAYEKCIYHKFSDEHMCLEAKQEKSMCSCRQTEGVRFLPLSGRFLPLSRSFSFATTALHVVYTDVVGLEPLGVGAPGVSNTVRETDKKDGCWI